MLSLNSFPLRLPANGELADHTSHPVCSCITKDLPPEKLQALIKVIKPLIKDERQARGPAGKEQQQRLGHRLPARGVALDIWPPVFE